MSGRRGRSSPIHNRFDPGRQLALYTGRHEACARQPIIDHRPARRGADTRSMSLPAQVQGLLVAHPPTQSLAKQLCHLSRGMQEVVGESPARAWHHIDTQKHNMLVYLSFQIDSKSRMIQFHYSIFSFARFSEVSSDLFCPFSAPLLWNIIFCQCHSVPHVLAL